MLNTTKAQFQNFRIKLQLKAMSGSDISLSNATCFNIGIIHQKFTTDVPYDLVPDTSRLKTQTWLSH